MKTQLQTLVRHEGDAPRERSTCGWRDRLISREDVDVAAWVHAVDIDGAREHYHKRATSLYYALEGDVHFKKGRKLRIGTDDPDGLESFLKQRVSRVAQ